MTDKSKMFKWLSDILKKSKKADELEIESDKLKIENNNLIDKLSINPLEEQFNNKYLKVDLTYKRIESDGEYQVDLRDFIQEYDSIIPIIQGKNDDEKALEALKWVILNIKYTPDSSEYKTNEYWAYSYQTLHHKKGDCEDGAFLLHNILLRSGVPYWKLRLSCGWVKLSNKKVGHAYLNYYCEKTEKWVVLDWCWKPNILPIEMRKDYKEEKEYLDVWFSWNQKYCFSKGLNKEAKHLLNQ